MQELVPCRRKFHWCHDLLCELLLLILILQGFCFDLGVLFQIDVHCHSHLSGLCPILGHFCPTHARSNQIAQTVLHALYLRDPQTIAAEHSGYVLLLLREHFHEGVRVLDGDTHLQQIFGENFVGDLVLDSLRDEELHQCDADLGLFGIELLVAAKFQELFLVEVLACQFFCQLCEH